MMKHEFIQAGNTMLAYKEKNPIRKQVLFFIHGNSGSSDCWELQLNSDLLENYRLIAIDLPAHGNSSASVNPDSDYTLTQLGKTIATAIIQLAGDSPYLIIGISMGTNIMAESLAFGLKPRGIVVAGSCLIGEKYQMADFAYPDTNAYVVFTDRSTEEEVGNYAAQVMSNNNTTIAENFIRDYYKVKLPFRTSLFNSIQNQQFIDELEIIASFHKPVLLIFGLEEKIINSNYLDNAGLNLWNNTVYKIPEAGHLVNLDQPEAFNRLLMHYALEKMQDILS